MMSERTLTKQRKRKWEEMVDEDDDQLAECRRGTDPPTSAHTPIVMSPDPSRTGRGRGQTSKWMRRRKGKKKKPQKA